MVFSTFHRSPLWPRQRGNVKEYNEVLDANVKRSQLQLYLPEEHLVKAYVGGLKDELRDSVESFQPRTIGGARAYAQMEEWDLQRQAKKADEARRLAKVQELSVAQNRVSTRQLSCLRQTGTLAKFNAKFDAISATLDLTKEYLVDIYVAALKDEIADSVQMFNPSTLGDARRLARLQEVAINRREAKAWGDRAGRYASNSASVASQSVNTNTELGRVFNQQSGPQHKDLMVSYANTTNATESSAKNADCSEKNKSSSDSSQACGDGKDMEEMTQTVLGVGCFVPPLAGCSSVDVLEGATTKTQVGAAVMSTCVAAHTSVRGCYDSATKPNAGVELLGDLCLSSSVSAIAKAVVSVCIVPLGPFPSLLSLFQMMGRRSLQITDYSHISTKFELVIRQDEELTWLQKLLFEKSNLQLSSICSKDQMYFEEVQLACNFSLSQEYFDSPLGLGFSFEENSPSVLLQLGLKRSEYRSDWLLQNGLSFFQCSPTQSLLHTWFRGELIKMLLGSGLDLLLLVVSAANK